MKETVILFQEVGDSDMMPLPWTPQKIKFESGDSIYSEVDIMDLGTVAQSVGVELRSLSWEGILPGKAFENVAYPWATWGKEYGNGYVSPAAFQGYFSMWQKNKTVLRVIISNTPVDFYVTVKKYSVTYKDAYGNYHYSIELQEDKKVNFTVTLPEADVTQGTERNDERDYTSYTVKEGDTLWGIAQCYLGDGLRETEIYSLNSEIIEETAKKHGYSSSNNGWWIFPGTVLEIPSSSENTVLGTIVELTNAPIYVSSDSQTVAGRVSGTYYLYDGKEILGRYRITDSSFNCGKTPVGNYVTGWLSKDYI